VTQVPEPCAIREVDPEDIALNSEQWLNADAPWVARGFTGNWPLVQAAEQGDAAFLDYLLRFCTDKKVSAFLGEPEIQGRFFYNADLSGFNFVQLDTTLKQLADKLQFLSATEQPPSLYMGSTNLDHWLPGLGDANQLGLTLPPALASLWLGNHSIVAPHFDYPANIACCVAGVRRFTLFPPDQVANLYIGPWDLTPAGQPISLVDIKNPDLEKYPRFEDAWRCAHTTDLQPGDVIYIPSLWWHQVESLAKVNGLINFWWTQQQPALGAPMDAFTHALLSIKQLPRPEREAWRALFDYYVFSESATDRDYWPSDRPDRTCVIEDPLARQLRAELTNHLRR